MPVNELKQRYDIVINVNLIIVVLKAVYELF